MPGTLDDRFATSVILLCAHSDDGAMGLMINRPTGGVRLSGLLEQLGIPHPVNLADRPIHIGGPVETERGFVLHSTEYTSAISSTDVTKGLAMTATLDIIEDMANGFGPDRTIVALGYCGWGPGQLEGQIARNGWLIGDADPEIVFSGDDSQKWAQALAAQGINPRVLSATAGRA